MPPPSELAIATSALVRLVKEDKSYHAESSAQEARIAKLEADQSNSTDENAEYILRQERKALEETKALFPQLKIKIEEAMAKVEARLVIAEKNADTSPELVVKAKDAIAGAVSVIGES